MNASSPDLGLLFVRFSEEAVRFVLEFGGLLTLAAAFGAVHLRTGGSDAGLLWLSSGFFAALTVLCSRPFFAVAHWLTSKGPLRHWGVRWSANAVIGLIFLLFAVGMHRTYSWLSEGVLTKMLDATC